MTRFTFQLHKLAFCLSPFRQDIKPCNCIILKRTYSCITVLFAICIVLRLESKNIGPYTLWRTLLVWRFMKYLVSIMRRSYNLEHSYAQLWTTPFQSNLIIKQFPWNYLKKSLLLLCFFVFLKTERPTTAFKHFVPWGHLILFRSL